MAYVIEDLVRAERTLRHYIVEKGIDKLEVHQTHDLLSVLGALSNGQLELNRKIENGQLLNNEHGLYLPPVDEADDEIIGKLQ